MKFTLLIFAATLLLVKCSAKSGSFLDKIGAILELEEQDKRDEVKKSEKADKVLKRIQEKDDDVEVLKRFAQLLQEKKKQEEAKQTEEKRVEKIRGVLEKLKNIQEEEKVAEAKKESELKKKILEDADDEESLKLLAKTLLNKLQEKKSMQEERGFLGNLGESFSQLWSNGEPKESVTFDSSYLTRGTTDACDDEDFPLVMRHESGQVTYPEGGGNYGRMKNCRWVFNCTDYFADKLTLEFTFMDIEEDDPCDDYVEVYTIKEKQGGSSNNNEKTFNLYPTGAGRMCGTRKQYFTFHSSAYVVFRSDYMNQGGGFALGYKWT